MRNTVLTTGEIPPTYKYNGTSFELLYRISENVFTPFVYWSSVLTGTNLNDWTHAGLQYFLNTEKDDNGTSGYYSTFTKNAKKLIDENYEYYLGNVDSFSTAIEAYEDERGTIICDSSITSNSHSNNCNIWNGNKPTWNGAIGLLYPSDYGYSVNSEYWNLMMINSGYGTAQTDGIIPNNTSWIQVTTDHLNAEWFISPSAEQKNKVFQYSNRSAGTNVADAAFGGTIRPVLYLISDATIDCNREGSKEDPYVVIES